MVGVSFGDYPGSARRAIDTTEVKKIKTFINSLHEGAANDGVVGNTQRGVMHGVSYSLEVEEFTNGEPKDEKNIKWIVKYHSLSTGKWIEEALPFRGKSTRLIANNIDMCGRFVYIKAYINSSNWIALDELKTPVTDAQREQKGELKLWHHNKFRWFDKKIVYKQAEERAMKPWRVDQGGTSLCGMASVFYLLAKKDSKGYEKLVKELFRIGSYTYNSYTIEPHKRAKDTMYNVNPYKDKDHPNIPEVDWITLGSVRSKESSLFGELLYKGKKGQDAEAINWPTLMKPLGKSLLGYTDVEMDYYKEVILTFGLG